MVDKGTSDLVGAPTEEPGFAVVAKLYCSLTLEKVKDVSAVSSELVFNIKSTVYHITLYFSKYVFSLKLCEKLLICELVI